MAEASRNFTPSGTAANTDRMRAATSDGACAPAR